MATIEFSEVNIRYMYEYDCLVSQTAIAWTGNSVLFVSGLVTWEICHVDDNKIAAFQ